MGWDILEPESVLAQQLLESDADFTILLSHLGWRFDEQAAMTFDNLNLILGAHTHHLYEYGKYINDTMLAAAGRYGEYVGEVTLRFDDDFQCIQSEIMAEDGIIWQYCQEIKSGFSTKSTKGMRDFVPVKWRSYLKRLQIVCQNMRLHNLLRGL
jgi:hypothetical protein